MNTKKVTIQQTLLIGLMTFGLFFGAGNLIFPVFLGQQAQANYPQAFLGFILSDCGFILIGIASLCLSQTYHFKKLMTKLAPIPGKLFGTLLYLVIGPLILLPRLASVSFKMGLGSFIPEQYYFLAMAIYTAGYFVIVYRLSQDSRNIVSIVGKVFTPLLLVTLTIVFGLVFIFKMGSPTQPLNVTYQTSPILQGFLDGYNTMDALVSVIFGFIIIKAYQSLGINDAKQLAVESLKSSLVAVVLITSVYFGLVYLGATSLTIMDPMTNGSPILVKVVHHYLGDAGGLLLMVIVISATLKTAIGLMSSFEQGLSEIYPRIKSGYFNKFSAILSFAIAMFGLDFILMYSNYLLNFVYPVVFILILIMFVSPKFGDQSVYYRFSVAFAILPIICNVLAAANPGSQFDFVNQRIPLGSMGFGWLLPAILGYFIAFLRVKKSKT
ncbi:branched-chain amino acid transport system II carrier protein [Holzapfeliella floricola]|uniref:Branched-chain amino acid transport system carrier protein n=1 Tax=Holzapfeliella floricola DSM 23037 = JCM 16512 TaxID=1423744 RepID=A0A0R2DKD6_9LACO|nr:branched-chain amino acid transport system II carrier protein [Holzapfeliella floricola]KRN04593.1 branched-chain amino acid transport protein [Holzapfeliella floricola DSM 23037 = JCM 16512]